MHVSIEKAAKLLISGHVVGIPTETVYGLAASVKCPEAMAQIFCLKGRPSNNPLILHLSTPEELKCYVKTIPAGAEELAAAFWPGPLTLVLPVLLDTVPEIARANLPTAAFRVPSHPLARALLEKTGPLVMPSANLSGKPSATTAQHVENDFGFNFPVLDGGPCHNGMESTILFWKEGEWVVIRLGALPPEAFEQILGYFPKVIGVESDKKPLCPGQSYRHYSPEAKLILATLMPPEGEVVIGFDDRHYPFAKRVFSLGCSLTPIIAVKLLYAVLRQLDDEGILVAWVDVDFPNNGLWVTLKERLLRSQSK